MGDGVPDLEMLEDAEAVGEEVEVFDREELRVADGDVVCVLERTLVEVSELDPLLEPVADGEIVADIDIVEVFDARGVAVVEILILLELDDDGEPEEDLEADVVPDSVTVGFAVREADEVGVTVSENDEDDEIRAVGEVEPVFVDEPDEDAVEVPEMVLRGFDGVGVPVRTDARVEIVARDVVIGEVVTVTVIRLVTDALLVVVVECDFDEKGDLVEDVEPVSCAETLIDGVDDTDVLIDFTVENVIA